MNVNKRFLSSAIIVLLSPVIFAGFGQAQTTMSTAESDSANNSYRVTLAGHTHPLAVPKYDLGPASDETPMDRILLVLGRSPEREALLAKLLHDQQTKDSPAYHQWLTPDEFGKQFGPTDADIHSVTNWLSSVGFHVDNVYPGRTVVEFSGTAGQVRRAFQAEIHRYSVNGKEFLANDRDPQIPSSFARVIKGFASLNNFPRKPFANLYGNYQASNSSGNLIPEVTLPTAGCASDGNCYGVGPADFATIYDVQPLYTAGIDGTGQTVAIASDSNFHVSDVSNYRQLFNLPANDPQVIVNGPDPGIVPGRELEANLDAQLVGAVARNAKIVVVVTQTTSSTAGVSLSALYVINNNLAPVLNVSYGLCEDFLGAGGTSFYAAIWSQAAAEGITVVVPTGDTGSTACDDPQTEIAATHGLGVNGVASTAYNVAVGGTDFDQVGNWSTYWNTTNDPTTQSSAKSYIPENVWNDTCAENGINGCANPNPHGADLRAGGGGLSKYNLTPDWQMNTGAPLGTSRAIPDVSLFAGDGNNGSLYLFCQADANPGGVNTCNLTAPFNDIQIAGGTSASAAAFAGIMALVNQKTGGRQGNANFVLYPLSTNAAAAAFHDVHHGSNSVACVGGSPSCSNTGSGYGIIADSNGTNPVWSAFTGYDFATGLGSVDVANLVNFWTSVSFFPTTTAITTFAPTTAGHGQPINFTVQVTSPNGTPTGDFAIMVNPPSGTPFAAAAYTLNNGMLSGTIRTLPGGQYNITAHYAGDGKFAASDSAPIAVNIAPEASQTVLAVEDYSAGLICNSGIASEPYGSNYIIRVDVNTTGTPCSYVTTASAPTGTITLTEGGNPVGAGTYTLNAKGYLEVPGIVFSLGNHILTATYSGDSSYNPSTSATFVLQIVQNFATLSLTANPTTVIIGGNVVLRAFADTHSIGVAPTGQVTFYGGGVSIGSANLVGTTDANGFAAGVATLNYSPTGNISIYASYAGDDNYGGGPSNTVNITAGVVGFVLMASPNPLTVTAGQSGTTTITVTPSFGFTGVVNLACPASLPLQTTCAVSPSSVTIGADGNPQSATVTITTVGPSVIASAGLFMSSPEFKVGVAGGLFLLVLWKGVRRRRKLRLVLSSMLAILSVSFLGSCSAIVRPGSSHASTLTLNSTAIKSPQGQPVTIKAFVSADHDVTGTVDFLDNGQPLAQGVALQVGRAFYTISDLALGAHPITATYSGDGNTNKAATNTPMSQVIIGSTVLQITATSGNLSSSVNLNLVTD
jgi:hypothetical protein